MAFFISRDRKTNLLNVNFICAAYIVIWAISPPLAFDLIYRILAILAVVGWFISAFLINPKMFLVFRKDVVYVYVYILYTYVIMIATGLMDFEGFIKLFGILIFLLFFIFYDFYKKNAPHILKRLFWLAIMLYPVWMLITIKATFEDPWIMRKIVGNPHYADIQYEFSKKGVGGYGLVYSSLVTVASLAFLVKNKVFTSRLTRIYILFTFIVGLTLVLFGGFSIAILSLVLSLTIIITSNTLSGKKIATLLIIFGFVYSYSEVILLAILEQGVGIKYAVKIKDLLEASESGESGGTLGSRLELYLQSFYAFLDYPITGTYYDKNIKLGEHSTIMDTYARFGIVFGSIFLYVISAVQISFLRVKGFVMNSLPFVVIMLVFIIGGLNKIIPGLGVTLFIIFPTTMLYYNEKLSQNIN